MKQRRQMRATRRLLAIGLALSMAIGMPGMGLAAGEARPFAESDANIVRNGDVLSVSAPGVLANDTSKNGFLHATLVGSPENGSLQFYPDGGFEYKPESGFLGEDQFTYMAVDNNGQSSEATAYILVVEDQYDLSLTELARVLFERQLALIVVREEKGMIGEGLLSQYTALLRLRADRNVRVLPESLYELNQLLVDEPDLLEAFIADVDANMRLLQDQTLYRINALRLSFRRFLPELAAEPEAVLVDDTDVLTELLGAFDPESYVVSGAPNETLAAPGNRVIEVSPFQFSYLNTYGVDWQIPAGSPFDVNTEISGFEDQCADSGMPCVWPVGWDFMPWSLVLVWESSTLTQDEIEDIVTENGYYLSLFVDEQKLIIGDPYSDSGLTGFSASSLPSEGCPAYARCLVTRVLARDKLSENSLPWSFELRVEKLEDLAEPVIVEGPDGLPVLVDQEAVLFAKNFITVEPNNTNSTSYFEAALFPTFYSDRCTDCHSLDTPEALANHHVEANASYGWDIEEFIEKQELTLEPSAYVDGGHVMTCWNCHYIKTSHNGDPFHETEWKVPYRDLDINWYTKDVKQICNRVTTNLPTPEIRHEHFHEDARLHWAIEEPKVLGEVLEPAAEPMDWDEFLRRVDLWNNPGIGAGCP